MGTSQKTTAIRDLRTLFESGAVAGLSDGQLLERFVARRDEVAFTALVLRHGPMVWCVCRRILRSHHDAEDAFQATFLVLARRSASVLPREMIANWLYGVAYQTAMKARATIARRRSRERQVTDMPDPEAVSHDPCDELMPLLDQELSRLPDKYRTPVILCDLEGKTHKEAACQLGWRIGTLSGRLSRARALLTRRLSRRGLTLPVGSLAVLLSGRAASASVPASLVTSTVKAAGLIAVGQVVTAGLISARVATLAEEVLKAMLLAKLRLATAVLLMAAAAGGIVFQTRRPPLHERVGNATKIVMAEPQDKNGSREEMDARRTAEAFTIAMSEGKLKQAARLCWPEEFDEEKLRELKKALGGNRLTVESVDRGGDVALALSSRMKLKADDGGEDRTEFVARLLLVLCYKDGRWQVQVLDLGPADRMERDRKMFRTQFPEPERVRLR